jgi:hypothetical protein
MLTFKVHFLPHAMAGSAMQLNFISHRTAIYDPPWWKPTVSGT